MKDIHPIFRDGYKVGQQDAISAAAKILESVATASIEDPGEHDLDDEQPITVVLTLKEVRLARSLLRKYRGKQ